MEFDATFRGEFPFLSTLLCDTNPLKPPTYQSANGFHDQSLEEASPSNGVFRHQHLQAFDHSPISGASRSSILSTSPDYNQSFSMEKASKDLFFFFGADVTFSCTHTFDAYADDNILSDDQHPLNVHNNVSGAVPDSVNGIMCGLQANGFWGDAIHHPHDQGFDSSKPISEAGINSQLFVLGDFGIISANKLQDENGKEMTNQLKKNKGKLNIRRGIITLKKANILIGQRSPQQDRLMVQLVERYGTKKWSQIAKIINGRVGKQCRERWHNHLRPDIKIFPFSLFLKITA